MGDTPNYDNRSRGFSQNIPRYLTPNFSKISDENEDFNRAPKHFFENNGPGDLIMMPELYPS